MPAPTRHSARGARSRSAWRGHHEELALHLRAALRNGLTVDEIKELLLQTAVYCGVPDANTAFRIAQQVLADDGTEEEDA